MEEHLCEEEEREDGEGCDGEYSAGWEEAVAVLDPDGVEEKQDELLEQEGDADAVHRATVDVLVDL